MRDSFRFLTGESDGTSYVHTAQRFCLNALAHLVENNMNIIATTIAPFQYEHDGRTFNIESITYSIDPTTNRITFRAMVNNGRYGFLLNYHQNVIDA